MMSVPSAAQLCGGFWEAYPSPLPDAYAAAAFRLGNNATQSRPGGAVRGWTLRVDQRVISNTAAGRPTYGYPAPADDLVWVAHGYPGPGLLVQGVDFDLADGLVRFWTDPLLDDGSAYLLWIEGVPVRALDVWHGTGSPPVASPAAPAGTYAALVDSLAATCLSPATGAGRETIAAVWQGPDHRWRVVTDAAAYRLEEADTPNARVVPGAVLATRSALGSAWALTRLGPALPDLAALTTPAWFHQDVLATGITWYNETVPLVIDSVAGRTRVRWRLGAASQGDLDAFWTQSHQRGLVNGRTLAQALDLRTNPTDDPGPESLPATINPLQVLCRELLQGTAYALVLDSAALSAAAVAAAQRQAAWRQAAGAYATVFEFVDTIPQLIRYDPS